MRACFGEGISRFVPILVHIVRTNSIRLYRNAPTCLVWLAVVEDEEPPAVVEDLIVDLIEEDLVVVEDSIVVSIVEDMDHLLLEVVIVEDIEVEEGDMLLTRAGRVDEMMIHEPGKASCAADFEFESWKLDSHDACN